MVERSPYCDIGGLFGDCLAVSFLAFDDRAFRPPTESICSALSSSGPSSGAESSSKIVFRFAGGGRVTTWGDFFVRLRPKDRVGMTIG